ncbi:hypothetical protein O5698_00650 [Escherichia coli]|nr:hypothetical protein [Escherichia coli]
MLIDAIASIASDAGCAIPQSMQLEMQETASRKITAAHRSVKWRNGAMRKSAKPCWGRP